MTTAKQNGKRKPKFLGYKIAAIAVAVLLWFYVVQIQNPTTEQVFTVSLEARNLAADYVLSDQNYQIQVRVQGAKQFLDNATARDIEAYVDLSGLEAGQHTVNVKVALPDQMEFVSVNPEELTINIEKLQTATFPVDIEVTGTPAEGYSALEAQLEPQQVEISGSSAYLDSIARVFVSVAVDDLNSSYRQSVTIEAANEKGDAITQWLTITPEYANVYVPIIGTMPQKQVPVDVSIQGTPAAGYQLSYITVDPSFVTVYGDLDRLFQVSTVPTVPIDITGATSSVTETLDLVVDNNLTLGGDIEVKVYLQIERTAYRTFENLRIHEQNLDEGLQVQLQTETATVDVSGPTSTVSALTDSSVIPYVDCSDLSVGTYELPIKVSSPANIKSQQVSPSRVTVVITRNN